MSLQIYKPNDKNTGCACSFKFGVDLKRNEPIVFVNAIQQHGWDAKERVGSFTENANNPDKSLTIKLNEVECGEFISAFENRHEYSAYHDFDENKTSIKISPWDKKRKISVKDPKIVMIKNFLNLALNKIYEARLKKQQEYQAKKRAEQQK